MKSTATVIAVMIATAAQPTLAAATVCDAVWTDAARQRSVPVRVRIPAGATTAPVVLFSHGLGGTYAAGTDWAEAWAGAGIATIHIQHAGSDEGVWKGAVGQDRLAVLRGAATGAQLAARVADVRFILDAIDARRGEVMAGGCRLAIIDRTRVGMAGHSFGAVTTQALAGQRFATGAMARETRIKAAIAFSPSPARQLGDVESFGAVTIPFMSVTGTADIVPMLDRTSAADRTRPYAAMPPGAKSLLVLDGADHSILGGRTPRRAPAQGDARIKALVASATTAFWRVHLLGDKTMSGGLPSDALALKTDRDVFRTD